MIVTENDIASGRLALFPMGSDSLSYDEAVLVMRRAEEAFQSLGIGPSPWARCIGADTDRGVLTCQSVKKCADGTFMVVTDGGPEANPVSVEVFASFRVVDVATGQEVARTA